MIKDKAVKDEILRIMDLGTVTDKQEIFTMVTKNLNVPRPTVRRIARDLRLELLKKIQVLQSHTPLEVTDSW